MVNGGILVQELGRILRWKHGCFHICANSGGTEIGWQIGPKFNVFIGAGAYEDMAHPVLPQRRSGEWGEIGAGTLVLPHLCNFGGKGDSWLAYWDEWWRFLSVTCKSSTHEDWQAFVDKFNQVPGLLLGLKINNRGNWNIVLENVQQVDDYNHEDDDYEEVCNKLRFG